MTLSETRKLGIEFERRVQTMIPEKEYLDKLDTETIYAYLNSYLDKYIHDIYRNLDQIKSGSKLSAHVESILQEMLRTLTISVEEAKKYTVDITDANSLVIVENGRSVTYPLDPSFYMYVRSVSNVTSTYSFRSNEPANGSQRPIRVIPNELVSQSDLWRILETPHNSLRILRYPAASIGAYEMFGSREYDVVRLQVKQDFHSTEYGLDDNGHMTNGDVFRLKTYSRSLCDPNEYVLAYSGKDTRFRFCKVLRTFINGEEDFNVYGRITSNATIEQIKEALFVEDPDDIYYILVWLDGKHAGLNTITMTQLRNKPLPTLNVIYDRYTTPVGIKVVYYAQPQHFDLMTSTPCQLPMDAFDDLVTGAVDLYVQYVAGAEAKKRQQDEANRKRAREDLRDSRRSGGNQDEQS